MGKRIYVNPKLTVVELTSSAMLSVSLGISDDTIETPGRSREYDNHDEQNNNSVWEHGW